LLLKTFLRDLVLSSPGDRGWLRSAAYLLPLAAVILYAHTYLYTGTQAPTTTAHPEQSMNVALNAAYCGKPQMYTQRYSAQNFLSTRPDLMSKPFRNVIAAMAGSVDNYCHYANEFVVVSENSLMWLMRLALWQNVHLTADQLGDFLGAVRVGMLIVFGFALLRTGSSILFTLAAMALGGSVLRSLGVRDSIYPFVTAMPLLNAGLYGLAMSVPAIRRGGAWSWAFALAMGVLTAFCASMRTVHLPMFVAMFAMFLVAMFVVRDRSRAIAAISRGLAAAVVAFLVGYYAYLAVFVNPLRISTDPGVSNYVYHTFAHQLVIGLGVPDNEFATREGIKWDDMVGFALAKRAMPKVIYLGPTYEEALLTHYRGLWREHPREMLEVYAIKARSNGVGVFESFAGIGEWYHVPRVFGETLHTFTNGFAILAIVLAAFLAALWRYLRGGRPRVFVIALVALAALTSMTEGFLTYSIFVGLYYSIVLYFMFFLAFVLVQSAADAVAARTLAR
jgi:hypothetical protein